MSEETRELTLTEKIGALEGWVEELTVSLNRLQEDLTGTQEAIGNLGEDIEGGRLDEMTQEVERLRAVIQTCPGCVHHSPSDPLGCPQAGRSYCATRTTVTLAPKVAL